jgi:hypothetical protein
MPRLSDPKMTKGRAAGYLVSQYLNEPEFAAQLQELRAGYLDLLAELIVNEVEILVRCRETMTADEYQRMIRGLYASFATGPALLGLPAELQKLLEHVRQLHIELRPYFRALEQLASDWKLNAPWAGPLLHLWYVHDCLKGIVIPDDIDLSAEQLDLLYPWPPLLPPIEFKLSSSALALEGRKQLLAEIRKKLEAYEKSLKLAGAKEVPRALERHARWWFDHHVKGKTYRELSQEYPRAYQETIKRKVWEFSKMLGMRAH